MLVGTGLEKDIVSLSSLITGNGIRQHDLVGISDMRLAGGIGNCGCHIKLFVFHNSHSLRMFVQNIVPHLRRFVNPPNLQFPDPESPYDRFLISFLSQHQCPGEIGVIPSNLRASGNCRSLPIAWSVTVST